MKSSDMDGFASAKRTRVTEPGAVATGSRTQVEFMTRSLPLPVLYQPRRTLIDSNFRRRAVFHRLDRPDPDSRPGLRLDLDLRPFAELSRRAPDAVVRQSLLARPFSNHLR